MKKVEINKNWKFKINQSIPSLNKYPNMEEWRDALVPGTVHTDLLNSGLIDNPFFDDNELKLQWISDCDWIYTTSFDYPKKFDWGSPVKLVFEGLDTIAEVLLNGTSVNKCNNMFRDYEIDITNLIKEKSNKLIVKFSSPTGYAKQQEKRFGKLYVEVNSERVYTRKAQYSFGWDWGPSFPTMGIYKQVYLSQKNSASIKSVKCSILEASKEKALVEVNVDMDGDDYSNTNLEISFHLYDQLITKKMVKDVSIKNKLEVVIEYPKLWWPCCIGDQPRYELKLMLRNNDGREIDSEQRLIGIRTIDLILKEDNSNTFKFLINNKEIFIKGVNWIPTDSFLPRVSREKYIKLLSLAKNANCNMIRVWGGGVYENDTFYELCDEYGLLVWQDFMFACGSYPEHDDFIENVIVEIEQNVDRLQYHPSIAIWCGNNECEWLWFQKQDKPFKELPGYKIYHNLIPQILGKIDPYRPYWPSSPFGYDEDPNDQKSGNTHQWNIWSNWIDYSEVTKDNSFFVSEFGFQAPANKKTWEKALSKENLNCDNSIFDFHNKQVDGQKRISKFMSDHLPVSCNWDDYIYLAQLNQGFALKSCIEHWISNRPTTNGAIIWQLNDCWPAVSWSIIDSELIPKLSYYFIKKIFSPIITTINKEGSNLKINLNNHCREPFEGNLKISLIEQRSGIIINEIEEKLSAKSSIKSVIHELILKEPSNNRNPIIVASLYNKMHELIYRDFYIDQKWKNIKLPEMKLEFDIIKENDLYITVKSETPAFFVDLFHPKINFDDRGFILLPGEEKTIQMSNQKKRKINFKDIKIFALNNYLRI